MKRIANFLVPFAIVTFTIILLGFMQLSGMVPGEGEKEHFVLGADDGDGQLIYPQQVKEGPDGNIYVLDSKDGFIKVYSPTGKFLRKFGGQGEGPGKLKRIDGATFGFTVAKRLFFTEFFRGHRWITELNLDGSLHVTCTPKMKNMMLGISKAVSLPGGRYLIEFSFLAPSEKQSDYYLHRAHHEVFLFNSKGEIVSEIKENKYFDRISYFERGADIGLPFTPMFMWSLFRQDNIIYTDGVGRTLKVINFKGEEVQTIQLPLPEPVAVTPKDLREWKASEKERFNLSSRGKAWFMRFGKVIEKYNQSVHKTKPLLEGISVTPEGNILIVRAANDETERDFRLLSGEGKTLANVVLNGYDLKIFGGFIFFKSMDEEENDIVHCFLRKGGEKEDLKRIEKRIKTGKTY
jgi:hypothetical protein